MRQSWRVVSRLQALLVALAAGGTTQTPELAQAAITPGEQAAWDRARGSGSAAAFQRYLELYPTGQYAEEAFRILVEKSWRAPGRTDPANGAAGTPEANDPTLAQILVAAQSLY